MMNALSKIFALFSILALTACSAENQQTENTSSGPDYSLTYDLHISGGTIVDGTGDASYMGDILVSGDKIAYIGDVDGNAVKAANTIDATGRIVTPGFIDAHSHGDPLQEDNDHLRNFLRQGITTVLLGQDGTNPGYFPSGGPARDASSFRNWIDQVNEKGSGPNVATLVGHGTIRQLSGGGEKDKITPEEQAKMEELFVDGMMAGAYGLNTGLEYVPGRYADKEEMFGLAKLVGKHDGVISSHIRNEDDDKVHASIAELIEQGQFARVNASHIKVVYGKTRDQGDAVLNQIREARANGIEITADVYPYLASFGNMTYLYPEWAKREFEFNDAVANRRAEFKEFLTAKIKRRNGPGAILVSSGEYSGKTVADISEITGKDPEDVIMDYGHGGPATAHFIMTKETQDAFITAPDVSISTDGSPTMRHPRSFGSFPKVLHEYVVRDKLMSLELAINKMTGQTADIFDIQTRGRLKQGMGADILVIDLENVRAGTTWTDIFAEPTGFDAVIVNGKATDISAGSDSPIYGRVLLKTKGD
ncbi:N-acyl-D-amino-acid deacylase family protein [Pseudemcibacter aquimaris]|uniref:N-acyl-D-amino-acid deacylase family protein n=1 Tax=Pseudemcibacter aquimaris TaxID=2857064 RepID=UPI002011C97A|nr:amidohydrolase family protein [Pseudemcibacter aquimaris]MCC3861860.1 amidohydrolase family protein [Pseudemcibacter aquimaris]WDU58613.1 amidohydrolase family protein [Pseudemcibacter aquimaris]